MEQPFFGNALTMMMETPILSIVICTRNRGKSLGGTIDSLTKIESDYVWEAIFVDNASTDNTMQVLRDIGDKEGRFRYLRVDRVGLGAARDAGWRQARGRIVSFTDDDCYLAPDYVNKVVEVFSAHPEAGCVGGRILLHDPQDARMTVEERSEPFEIRPFQFLTPGELQGANLSFRVDVLKRVNGFDPDLGAGTKFPCEDIDILASALWAGFPVRFDPRPLVFHHHGRKWSEVDRIVADYDRGRGAYYAKYILRRDTRKEYIINWWRAAHAFYYLSTPRRLFREFKSAAAYFVHRKRYDILLIALPIWLVTGGAITLIVVMRMLLGKQVKTSWKTSLAN
jgi:glycosyltransferase involved in cell wall biosynthesis